MGIFHVKCNSCCITIITKSLETDFSCYVMYHEEDYGKMHWTYCGMPKGTSHTEATSKSGICRWTLAHYVKTWTCTNDREACDIYLMIHIDVFLPLR